MLCKNLDDLNDFEKNRYKAQHSVGDTYDALLIENLKAVLTPREQTVVNYLYFHAFNIAETTVILHISRQAANNIKLSALNKLRNAYYEFYYGILIR